MAKFFMDNWISWLGPLWQFKLPGITYSDATTISEFTTAEGGWDVGLLSMIFPLEIVGCVLAVPPPNVALGCDKVTWLVSSNGVFSVRSAYRSLELLESSATSDRWLRIWKCPIPPRVQHFLWLVCRRSLLLTNAERVRRCMADDAAYVIWWGTQESIIQVLRDCSFEEKVWLKCLREAEVVEFFSL